MRTSTLLVGASLLLAAACSPLPGTAQSSLEPTALRTPANALPIPSPAPSAPASPTPSPTTTPPPAVRSNPQRVVLATDLPSPDDLALAPDGSIYISDIALGRVERLGLDGRLQTLVSGLSVPEGIAVLPDGSLVIAEQGRNRLVRFDPATGRLTPFASLPNRTGKMGVDGVTLDAHLPGGETLLVPDSPNGTLLRLSLDGKSASLIAGGFGRPTAAWAESDGSILVADEDANALLRLRPDGTLVKLADLPIPDDVIADEQGNVFVNTLGDGAIHWISTATGQDVILAAGLLDPQGLIFAADGNLVVAEAGRHRLIELVIH